MLWAVGAVRRCWRVTRLISGWDGLPEPYGRNGSWIRAFILCLSVSLSVCLSVCLSVSGWDNSSQPYGRNGSWIRAFILCLSVCLSQAGTVLINHTVETAPGSEPLSSVCLSLCLSVCLSLRLGQFFSKIRSKRLLDQSLYPLSVCFSDWDSPSQPYGRNGSWIRAFSFSLLLRSLSTTIMV